MPDLLGELIAAGYAVACLSNDVSAWSVLLRERFELTRWIKTWVISADIGARKPADDAYAHLLRAIEVQPSEVLFVDDHPINVTAARRLGIRSLLFAGVDSITEALA